MTSKNPTGPFSALKMSRFFTTTESNRRLSAVFLAVGLVMSSGKLIAQNVWIDGVVKPYKAVIISASLREIIRKIEVSEGDRIKEGQMLVRLESEKQRLSVERYALVISKATFDQKAAQRLFEQNVASRDDAMNKDIELKRLQVEQDIARAELSDREIKSPLNGVVVRKLKESGESVNETEPILQIMETDRLLLSFYLEADMLTSVKLGQELATRYPELSSEMVKKAVVDFIDPEVDARSGLFRVRLLLDNKDDSIKPGMRVQTEFPAAATRKPVGKPQQ